MADESEEEEKFERNLAGKTRSWIMIALIGFIAIGVPLGALIWHLLGGAQSQQAQQDAQSACLTAPFPSSPEFPHSNPGWPSTNPADADFGNILDAFRTSEAEAKAAATGDSSWNSLAIAYATLVAAWTARVAITGRAQPTVLSAEGQTQLNEVNARWSHPEHLAELTIEQQCAKDGVQSV